MAKKTNYKTYSFCVNGMQSKERGSYQGLQPVQPEDPEADFG